MIKSSIFTTVRYSEVDQLGIIYYSRFFEYFEIGRLDLLENFIKPYSLIELEMKIGLPVIEAFAKYYYPGKLGDKINIVTSINDKPTAKLHFGYILSVGEKIIVEGYTVNAITSISELKPKRDHNFLKLFEPYFDKT